MSIRNWIDKKLKEKKWIIQDLLDESAQTELKIIVAKEDEDNKRLLSKNHPPKTYKLEKKKLDVTYEIMKKNPGVGRATIFRIKNNNAPSRATMIKLERENILGTYEHEEPVETFDYIHQNCKSITTKECDVCGRKQGQYFIKQSNDRSVVTPPHGDTILTDDELDTLDDLIDLDDIINADDLLDLDGDIINFNDNTNQQSYTYQFYCLYISRHKTKRYGVIKASPEEYTDIKYQFCEECIEYSHILVKKSYKEILEKIMAMSNYNQISLASDIHIDQSTISRILGEEIEYLTPQTASSLYNILHRKFYESNVLETMHKKAVIEFKKEFKMHGYSEKNIIENFSKAYNGSNYLPKRGKQEVSCDILIIPNGSSRRIACFFETVEGKIPLIKLISISEDLSATHFVYVNFSRKGYECYQLHTWPYSACGLPMNNSDYVSRRIDEKEKFKELDKSIFAEIKRKLNSPRPFVLDESIELELIQGFEGYYLHDVQIEGEDDGVRYMNDKFRKKIEKTITSRPSYNVHDEILRGFLARESTNYYHGALEGLRVKENSRL